MNIPALAQCLKCLVEAAPSGVPGAGMSRTVLATDCYILVKGTEIKHIIPGSEYTLSRLPEYAEAPVRDYYCRYTVVNDTINYNGSNGYH